MTLLTQNDKKPRGTPSPDDAGANVSRRPSQRQQEKSPENGAPHPGPDASTSAHADAEDETDGAGPAEDSGAGVSGNAGADSRFRESL
jgi:hypothetical protein